MLAEALERMPHAGPMQLIERIVSADASGIRCLAKDHSAPTYPLRLDGCLHGGCLVELGAQAAAAHTSLFASAGAHTGLVLALSNLEIARDRVDTPERLTVLAALLQALGGGASYRVEVFSGAGLVVASDLLLGIRGGPA
ncbi:MAG TPA: hypothetical protein VMM59_09040 [Thermohalobaculum sp.]|nr:hypothetical protein [Thermohalobaculum sp.]